MQFKISCVRKIIISFVVFIPSINCMHDSEVSTLKEFAINTIVQHESLIQRAIHSPQDLQDLIIKKIIAYKIKPSLFPVKIKQPENPRSMNHYGVCGLETISSDKQIISVGCDGEIAVCKEDAMQDCRVLKTGNSWVCACLKCNSSMLCLGDISGNIGYFPLQDTKTKNIFRAHDQMINALSLSKDQTQLVSCSNDSLIKLWRIDDNKKLGTFIGHGRSVKNAFPIDSDQKLISAGIDRSIRIWDIGTEKQVQIYSLLNSLFTNNNFTRLTRHPNEKISISGLTSGMLAIWDMRQNRHVSSLQGHTASISALLCAQDGNYIASAGWDSKTRIWDLRMLSCSAILSFHEGWIQSISSMHEFRKVVSGSRDGTVKLWDISSILAMDKANNLKETFANAKLIDATNSISNKERLAILKKITQQIQTH